MLSDVDHMDVVMPLDASARKSSIAVWAGDGRDLVALASGHGLLPFETAFDLSQGTHGVEVLRKNGSRYHGVLVRGELSPSSDYSVFRVPGRGRQHAWTHHLLGGARPRVRTGRPEPNEALHMFAGGRRTLGVVRNPGQNVQVSLRGFGTMSFVDLITVARAPGFPRFSRTGDSGSLVFDMHGRAVGLLVGQRSRGDQSFVLPIDVILPELGDLADAFFEAG